MSGGSGIQISRKYDHIRPCVLGMLKYKLADAPRNVKLDKHILSLRSPLSIKWPHSVNYI